MNGVWPRKVVKGIKKKSVMMVMVVVRNRNKAIEILGGDAI